MNPQFWELRNGSSQILFTAKDLLENHRSSERRFGTAHIHSKCIVTAWRMAPKSLQLQLVGNKHQIGMAQNKSILPYLPYLTYLSWAKIKI